MANAQDSQIQKHQDCVNALFLCSTDPVAIPALAGQGQKEQVSVSCLDRPFQETNSVWFRWRILQSGLLSFNLLPFDASDDLDFVLFKTIGDNPCHARTEIRCMTSGENLGEATPYSHDCLGATGLREQTPNARAAPGCGKNAQTFLAAVDAAKGEEYILLVNNFSSHRGFLLEFTGTATFDPKEVECAPATASAGDNYDFSDGFSVGQISPNPVGDQFQLDVAAPVNGTCQASIFAATGKLCFAERFNLTTGFNRLTLPSRDLPTGVYYVRMEAGGEMFLLRFVKS